MSLTEASLAEEAAGLGRRRRRRGALKQAGCERLNPLNGVLPGLEAVATAEGARTCSWDAVGARVARIE